MKTAIGKDSARNNKVFRSEGQGLPQGRMGIPQETTRSSARKDLHFLPESLAADNKIYGR